MLLVDKTLREFTEVLASKAPTPGGGGGAAAGSALGMALGSMVANLTVGKKGYEEYQDEIYRILGEAKVIQDRLLDAVDADAAGYGKLNAVYKMPKGPERDEAMERESKNACAVPIQICELSLRAIKLHQRLVTSGNKMAISDVTCGVLFCEAALVSGMLNVKINLNSIKDQEYVKETDAKVNAMVEEGKKITKEVYDATYAMLAGAGH